MGFGVVLLYRLGVLLSLSRRSAPLWASATSCCPYCCARATAACRLACSACDDEVADGRASRDAFRPGVGPVPKLFLDASY